MEAVIAAVANAGHVVTLFTGFRPTGLAPPHEQAVDSLLAKGDLVDAIAASRPATLPIIDVGLSTPSRSPSSKSVTAKGLSRRWNTRWNVGTDARDTPANLALASVQLAPC